MWKKKKKAILIKGMMQQATDPGMQKGTFQHFCMLTCLLAETIDTTLMSLG